MKLQTLLVGLILWSCSVHAQNMVSMSSIHPDADTISASKKELAIRYPDLRQFNITVDGFGYSDFDAKLNDNNFASGKIKTERISTFFNSPAIKWKGNSLSASVYYTYTSIELKNIANEFHDTKLESLTTNKSTFDLALNYSRSDKIFNHPIIYSLIARGISDGFNSIRRFNLNGSFNIPIKRTKNTSFFVGLLVLIDPSSPIPVEPIVNYYHKFTSSGLELIVDLPNGVHLKKQLGEKTWFTIGSNQHSYTTFYDHHNTFLDGKVSYNTIELKSGAAFEYLFAKNIMLSIGGGFNNYLSAKVFKDGENYSNTSLKSENKGVPYINIGLSLLTF